MSHDPNQRWPSIARIEVITPFVLIGMFAGALAGNFVLEVARETGVWDASFRDKWGEVAMILGSFTGGLCGYLVVELLSISLKRRRTLSLRNLFLAVALVAVTIGCATWFWRNAELCGRRSDEHMETASMFHQVVDVINQIPSPNAKQAAMRDEFEEKVGYHVALSDRYRQAKWRPWVVVDEEHQ